MPYGYPEDETGRFMHNVINNQLHVVTTLSSTHRCEILQLHIPGLVSWTVFINRHRLHERKLEMTEHQDDEPCLPDEKKRWRLSGVPPSLR